MNADLYCFPVDLQLLNCVKVEKFLQHNNDIAVYLKSSTVFANTLHRV